MLPLATFYIGDMFGAWCVGILCGFVIAALLRRGKW